MKNKKNKPAFFDNVEKLSNGCWIWIGSIRNDGFGTFRENKKTWLAHRYSWSCNFGNLKSTIMILHRCHNNLCVNPNHLYLGKDMEEERFWKSVNKKSDDECWEWKINKTKFGYGKFMRYGRITILAHRYSWIIHNGEIPADMLVCHKCDNPSCVNPNHLFLGTYKENFMDAVKKGRKKNNGENNPTSKLKYENVREIRELWKTTKMPQREIGELFGIKQPQVSAIVHNKQWKEREE